MDMDIEVQNTARRCHSIHEYTQNDIKVCSNENSSRARQPLQNFAPFQHISVTKKST